MVFYLVNCLIKIICFFLNSENIFERLDDCLADKYLAFLMMVSRLTNFDIDMLNAVKILVQTFEFFLHVGCNSRC